MTSHLLIELQMSEHVTHMDTDNCLDGGVLQARGTHINNALAYSCIKMVA